MGLIYFLPSSEINVVYPEISDINVRDSMDTVYASGDTITQDRSPIIYGTSTTGYIITIYKNGAEVTSVPVIDNAWSYEIPDLPNGTYSITVAVSNGVLTVIGTPFNFTIEYLGKSEPYFSNNILLLPGDGIEGGQNQTFVDASLNNASIIRSGNVTQGTFSPFYNNWGTFFDGAGDYIALSDFSSVFNGFADTSTTIELWTYPIMFSTLNNYKTTLIGNYPAAKSAGGWLISLVGSSSNTFRVRFQWTTQTGVSESTITTTSQIAINRWTHIAITVDATSPSSSIVTIYINGGKEQFTGNDFRDQTATQTPYIGGNCTASNDLYGYISNLRITKSLIYSANFTPSSLPLQRTLATVLITCNSSKFVDTGGHGFAVTNYGNACVMKFSPFSPGYYTPTRRGGSAYFDGAGDYLTTTLVANEFSTIPEYTIECWIYPTVIGRKGIIGTFGSSSVFGLHILTTGQLACGYSTTSELVSNSILTANQWYHVAMVKQYASVFLFLNGQLVATRSNILDFSLTTTNLRIGGYYISSSYNYTGYISDLHISKIAKYVINFDVNTTPTISPTEHTQLLMNFTNASIRDLTSTTCVETVGTASTTLQHSKFGLGSIYLNGSADYIRVIDSPMFKFGVGDFTIEMWIYPVDSSSKLTSTLVSIYGLCLSITNTGQINLNVTGSTILVASSSPTPLILDNTWQHVAVTKQSTLHRLFINGQLVNSNTTNNIQPQTTTGILIGQYNGTQYYKGYYNDVRITKGLARYTMNFEVPSEPLPVN